MGGYHSYALSVEAVFDTIILFLVISNILSIIVSILYLTVGDEYISEMKTVTDTEGGTAVSRIESWKAGWRMFLDNPLGVGGNNFQVRFPEYQGEHFQRGMWGRVAHSLWFTLIPELGIIGIWIYFMLLIVNLKNVFFLKSLKDTSNNDIKYLQHVGLAMLASFVGYFASGTFLSVLYYAHYWYLIPILVASNNIAVRLQTSNE
jgi:O-antigen ligase